MVRRNAGFQGQFVVPVKNLIYGNFMLKLLSYPDMLLEMRLGFYIGIAKPSIKGEFQFKGGRT